MAAPEHLDCDNGVAVAFGMGFTTTVAVIAVPEQLPAVGVMVNVTVMGALVVLVNAPLMSPLPLAAIPVTVPVLSLVQSNCVPGIEPESAIVVMVPPVQMDCDDGVATASGVGFTVTVVPADVADVQPPLVTVTEYVPAVETVIACVIAPVDHRLPVADDEVKVTLPPVQNVVGPPAVMVGVGGTGLTVPLTATLIVVIPTEATVIFPEGVPVADAAIRTYMVVLGTEPPDWVKVTVAPNPLPLVVEISKSAGAVIIILAVNALPDTVKLCSAEAVPAQLVNAVNGVPVTFTAGNNTFRKLQPVGNVIAGGVLSSTVQLAWLFNAARRATREPATAGKLQIPYLALLCSEAVLPGVPIQMAFTPVVKPVGKALILVPVNTPSHEAAVVVVSTFM